ncbi:hypothetical protein GCM10025867_20510 [Frondihabitans sucicola]|uniref:Uncharacterized protein n=1 Tax=Frondihabitans sucicola TaxID=1268041 RepID=A0ABM8GMZ1_9MICO|nr:hypothetical protein GCM10025867_20510 [Frondihabitans sucicola]
MGEVEETGRLADGVVLLQIGRVADGHLPAGEVGEARTGLDVDVVERAVARFDRTLVGRD